MRERFIFAALICATAIGHPLASPTDGPCERLFTTKLANTTITTAQTVTDGTFTPEGAKQPLANLPDFCRATGTIRPTKESEILFEVWLPLEKWTGRFVGVGNGGWAGNISYGALAEQIRRGNAAVSTNTGHRAQPGLDMAKFAFDSPEQLIDFSSRSVHEMTVNGKALTRAFYGKDAAHSYWVGCSTGGKQGLTEAQRYPADYDGIVVGAPANNWTRLMVADFLPPIAAAKQASAPIGPSEFELLNKAVLASCDAADGVTDGVLEDPRQCTFDPERLVCTDSSEPRSCLTRDHVELVRLMYEGPIDPRNGAQLYPGLPRGSELAWRPLLNSTTPFGIPVSHYRWLVFADPAWDWKTFDLKRPSDYEAFLKGETKFGPILNAIDPDLRQFRDRGGKLLQWHGWNDQLIAAGNSIAYYESVVAFMGGSGDRVKALRDTQHFYRLYMAPGMLHCFGGPGPNIFDMQTAIERWVEEKTAPEAVIATRVADGKTDRSRPLCPYPQIAHYRGTGETNDAANFVCRETK